MEKKNASRVLRSLLVYTKKKYESTKKRKKYEKQNPTIITPEHVILILYRTNIHGGSVTATAREHACPGKKRKKRKCSMKKLRDVFRAALSTLYAPPPVPSPQPTRRICSTNILPPKSRRNRTTKKRGAKHNIGVYHITQETQRLPAAGKKTVSFSLEAFNTMKTTSSSSSSC